MWYQVISIAAGMAWFAVAAIFAVMLLVPHYRIPDRLSQAVIFLSLLGLSLNLLSGCTSQQVATITTDAATVCADISAVETAIGPLNLVPIVSTTEAYLGDACTVEGMAAADVPWLISFTGNLKATVAAVKLGKVPASP